MSKHLPKREKKMERRSVLKALTTIPFIKSLPFSHLRDSLPFNSQDKFEMSKDLSGIGVGIECLDNISNGFLGGQLISVYGPDDLIIRAFLVHTFLYQTLSEKNRVEYGYVGGSLGALDKNIAQFLDLPSPEQAWSYLSSNGNDELLRVADIDLGDPRNIGWKDFVKHINAETPDCVIIDDIRLMEEFLQERSMARQCKEMAVKNNIPVIVKSPLKGESLDGNEPSSILRSDFSTQSDVIIRLVPMSSTPYLIDDKAVGTRFTVKVFMHSQYRPNEPWKNYSNISHMVFIDYDLQFRSL